MSGPKARADQASQGYPVCEFSHLESGPALSHVEAIDSLREKHPFVRSTDRSGFWVLTTAELVHDALQRPEVFSNSAVTVHDPNPPFKWIPEMLDPPEHTKWRQLLAPHFTPKVIEQMEDRVRTRCVEIVDSFANRGQCDFLRDFAWRYPTTIFMELMGLPLEGLEQFLEWEHEILHLNASEDPDRSRARQAMVAVQGYFAGLIEDRRENPDDDLLSVALGWTIDGEAISHPDMLSWCLLMFMAGLDTVSNQLAYSFWHLATHDEDRARIVAEPSVIPDAVEELLRAFAFVAPARKVRQDTDFHGCPLKAGDMVLVPLSAATRDPAAFPDPTSIVLDRASNNHIAFGSGPHRCLGSHLARRELQIALEEWHQRIPDYRCSEGSEITEHGGGLFGIESLHLTWQ